MDRLSRGGYRPVMIDQLPVLWVGKAAIVDGIYLYDPETDKSGDVCDGPRGKGCPDLPEEEK